MDILANKRCEDHFDLRENRHHMDPNAKASAIESRPINSVKAHFACDTREEKLTNQYNPYRLFISSSIGKSIDSE